VNRNRNGGTAGSADSLPENSNRNN
jgi:hypothetical protein